MKRNPLLRSAAPFAIATAFLIAGVVPTRAGAPAETRSDPPGETARAQDLPVILPLPTPPATSADALTLEAQVTGRGEISRAVLWVKGEMDRVYRAIPMRSRANGTFAAKLGAWPSRGQQVRYYVEAWNAAGKARAGDPATPFVAQVFSVSTVKSLGSGPGGLWKGGIILGLVALSQLRALLRRLRPRPALRVASSERRSRLAFQGTDPAGTWE